MARILVAMSGGVDSSVAAARLAEQGHEVVGATLHLWDYLDDSAPKSRCCAPEDIHDAARVAAHLGFAHYAFDRRHLFASNVVTPFIQAYLRAETPSPCVHCNRSVKFAELLRIANRLGCSALATGHYARIVAIDGQWQLHRGSDTSKDQSYFLFALEESQLARVLFPLGESTKAEVRAQAQALGLPGAGKGESQELCFVETGQYDKFIEERESVRVRPGRILNSDGQPLGQHSGVHQFTLGQRKNLGVATGQRSYVVGLDPRSGDVTLGDRSDLLRDWARLQDVALASDIQPPTPVRCMVRYRGQMHEASVTVSEGMHYVHFERPAAPVVPGQFAVFFHGDRVVGGGKIVQTGRRDTLPRPVESP